MATCLLTSLCAWVCVCACVCARACVCVCLTPHGHGDCKQPSRLGPGCARAVHGAHTMTGSIRRRSRSHAAPSLLVRIRGSGQRPPGHWQWPPGSSGGTFSGGGSYPPCRWGVEHHRGGMRARGTERALAFTDSDSDSVRTATALGEESEPTRRARHEAQRLSRKLRAWPGLGPRVAAAMPGRHRRAFFFGGSPASYSADLPRTPFPRTTRPPHPPWKQPGRRASLQGAFLRRGPCAGGNSAAAWDSGKAGAEALRGPTTGR